MADVENCGSSKSYMTTSKEVKKKKKKSNTGLSLRFYSILVVNSCDVRKNYLFNICLLNMKVLQT